MGTATEQDEQKQSSKTRQNSNSDAISFRRYREIVNEIHGTSEIAGELGRSIFKVMPKFQAQTNANSSNTQLNEPDI